jgi:diadenosine tetraphosphate (Ap4A) HIT family hydrolase
MTDRGEGCPFCRREAVESQLIDEGDDFLIVADLHPLVEGHLLLIPKQHLACYGALPEACWAELGRLKGQVSAFLAGGYGEPTFFEHGVAGQTVPHAHLHAVPGLPSLLPTILAGREYVPAAGLSAIHSWFQARGPYLYCEEGGTGLLIEPGRVPAGYLERVARELLPGDVPHIDGRAAARRVRARWRRNPA